MEVRPKRPSRAGWRDFKQRAGPPPGVIVLDPNGPLRKSAVGTVVGALPPARRYVTPVAASVDLSSPIAIQLLNRALLRTQPPSEAQSRSPSHHESLSQPLSPIDSPHSGGSVPESENVSLSFSGLHGEECELAPHSAASANVFSDLDLYTGSYACR